MTLLASEIGKACDDVDRLTMIEEAGGRGNQPCSRDKQQGPAAGAREKFSERHALRPRGVPAMVCLVMTIEIRIFRKMFAVEAGAAAAPGELV